MVGATVQSPRPAQPDPSTGSRLLELDVLRGGAVILMVIFHFGFDLAEFGYTSYDTNRDAFWILFRGVILSSFLLAVGMSAYVAYGQCINWRKLANNVAKLLAVSLLISVASYIQYPQSFIYFGVIHFIALALLACLPFLRLPRTALLLGVAIIAAYMLDYFRFEWLWRLGVEHFHIPLYTVDLVSFSPWFGVVLIGVFVMDQRLFGWQLQPTATARKVAMLGRHSLLIYLVHQPLLFGLFYLFAALNPAV